MERRGWDEKKDWGRGKKGSGEGMGGWVHEGKGKAGAERWWVGPLVLPSITHPGALDTGRPGCTVPGIARERAAHTLGGPDGSHPVILVKRRCLWPPPPQKTAGGPSVPHNRTVSTAKGQTAHLPLIPSALLPSNCKTNANTQPSLVQPDPPEFLTSDESESGRRRKQFASSSQMCAKCKNS